MRSVVESAGGIIHRRELLRHVSSGTIQRAVRGGVLHRPFPGVLALPLMDAGPARMRAALLYAGDEAVLSHLSALALWGLTDLLPPAEPVHLQIPVRRRLSAPGIIAHRTSITAPVVSRSDLPVCRLEQALIDSWGWLHGREFEAERLRRALVIEAVGRRLTTAPRLRTALDERMGARGRSRLIRLVSLLDAGCRSELELWGFEHVFVGAGMPSLRRDVPVRLGGRTAYLDAFEPLTKTNIELDGRRWHSSSSDRERDIRRDAALATQGIQVVRFSGSRLFREPEAVRQELLEIIEIRR